MQDTIFKRMLELVRLNPFFAAQDFKKQIHFLPALDFFSDRKLVTSQANNA
jgi:hypothetical protein